MTNFDKLSPQDFVRILQSCMDCNNCPIVQKCEELENDEEFMSSRGHSICASVWLRWLNEETGE